MGFLRSLFGKKQSGVLPSSSGQSVVPRGSITCAKCMKGFEWSHSFHSRNTTGSSKYNPPGHGDFRPRVFCPHCGFLVAEWDIDRQEDRDRWTWFGENSKTNASASLPPSPLLYWGIEEIPDELVVYDKDSVDLQRVKRLFGKAGTTVPADVETLVSELEVEADESSPGKTTAIRTAILQIGAAAVVDPLITLLKSERVEVTAEAASLLGELGDKRAVMPLIETLKDERFYRMRRIAIRSAARSLGKLGDTRAIGALQETIRSDRLCIESRPAVLEAINKLGGSATSDNH